MKERAGDTSVRAQSTHLHWGLGRGVELLGGRDGSCVGLRLKDPGGYLSLEIVRYLPGGAVEGERVRATCVKDFLPAPQHDPTWLV